MATTSVRGMPTSEEWLEKGSRQTSSSMLVKVSANGWHSVCRLSLSLNS